MDQDSKQDTSSSRESLDFRRKDYWLGFRVILSLFLLALSGAVLGWAWSHYDWILIGLPLLLPLIIVLLWDSIEYLVCRAKRIGGRGPWSEITLFIGAVLIPVLGVFYIWPLWLTGFMVDIPTSLTQIILLLLIPLSNRLMLAEILNCSNSKFERTEQKNSVSEKSVGKSSWKTSTLLCLSGVVMVTSSMYMLLEVIGFSQFLGRAGLDRFVTEIARLATNPGFMALAICFLTPILALVTSVQLMATFLKAKNLKPLQPASLLGLALALFVIFVPTLPHTWNRHLGYEAAYGDKYDQTSMDSSNQREEYKELTRRAAIRNLRRTAIQSMLLEDCYGPSIEMAEFIGYFVSTVTPRFVDNTEFCNVFYRVYGKTVDDFPVPFRFVPAVFIRDMQRGFQSVGRKVAGLGLDESNIDASVDANAGVAYLEWVMVFKNDGLSEQESRVEIALPPRAVLSRAGLWVRGKFSEAAFTERGLATRTYQSFVVQNKDPLLVTQAGPDRVLAQCFPVPARGSMKIVLGMVVPLNFRDKEHGFLNFPEITDKNFDSVASHKISIKSFGPAKLLGPLQNVVNKNAPGQNLYSATTTDDAMRNASVVLEAQRDSGSRSSLSYCKDGTDQGFCVGTIADANAKPITHANVVIDASMSVAQYRNEIARAFENLPTGLKVNLMLATDEETLSEDNHGLPKMIPCDKNTPELIRQLNFAGGPPNWEPLQKAWKEASSYPGGALIWIHGPQPTAAPGFRSGTSVFSQRDGSVFDDSRPPTLLQDYNSTRVYDFEVRRGPNEIRKSFDSRTCRNAPYSVSVPRCASLDKDLAQLLSEITGKIPQYSLAVQKSADEPNSGKLTFSGLGTSLDKIWASEQTTKLINEGKAREAVEMATTHHILSPVTAAIVLEYRHQYKDAGIEPPPPGEKSPLGNFGGAQLNALNSLNGAGNNAAPQQLAATTRSSEGSSSSPSPGSGSLIPKDSSSPMPSPAPTPTPVSGETSTPVEHTFGGRDQATAQKASDHPGAFDPKVQGNENFLLIGAAILAIGLLLASFWFKNKSKVSKKGAESFVAAENQEKSVNTATSGTVPENDAADELEKDT